MGHNVGNLLASHNQSLTKKITIRQKIKHMGMRDIQIGSLAEFSNDTTTEARQWTLSAVNFRNVKIYIYLQCLHKGIWKIYTAKHALKII